MNMVVPIFFVGLVLFSIPFHSNPKSKYYFEAGRTISNLRHEKLEYNDGLLFGVGYKKRFEGLPNAFVDFEVHYAEKRGTLRNKSHPISMYGYGVVFDDIHIFLGYLEFLAKPGFSVRIMNGKRLKISMGPELSTRIVNRTYYIERRIIQFHNYDERENYKFDYYLEDYEPPNLPGYLGFLKLFYKTTINLNASAAMSFGPFDLEVQYCRGLLEDKHYTNLTINDKMDSFYFGIKYNF